MPTAGRRRPPVPTTARKARRTRPPPLRWPAHRAGPCSAARPACAGQVAGRELVEAPLAVQREPLHGPGADTPDRPQARASPARGPVVEVDAAARDLARGPRSASARPAERSKDSSSAGAGAASTAALGKSRSALAGHRGRAGARSAARSRPRARTRSAARRSPRRAPRTAPGARRPQPGARRTARRSADRSGSARGTRAGRRRCRARSASARARLRRRVSAAQAPIRTRRGPPARRARAPAARRRAAGARARRRAPASRRRAAVRAAAAAASAAQLEPQLDGRGREPRRRSPLGLGEQVDVDQERTAPTIGACSGPARSVAAGGPACALGAAVTPRVAAPATNPVAAAAAA